MYTKKSGYSHWMWIILIAVVLLLAWLIWSTVSKDNASSTSINNIAPVSNIETPANTVEGPVDTGELDAQNADAVEAAAELLE